ncbi:O-methyltransferase [Diaporthe helianthi]|uniref:O-methyltransferase n=1 Tax=Diaporthe helianthi TaxID=158607 RepID=A0A2P5HF13_DIAHE|nr:O-methyltransferase [Diaporthe helianthi]
MSAATVIQTLNSFDPAKCSGELERVQLISAARSLLAKATTPFEFGGGAKTTKQLAELIGADPYFLHRYLIHMVACNILEQVDGNTFKQTHLSEGLTVPTLVSWVDYLYEFLLPLQLGWPGYLKKNGLKEPPHSRDGAFQDVFKCPGKTLFNYMEEKPEAGDMFNTYIGGNVGHDLEKFLAKHPGTASRLVLEDLPEVIERVKHNFFHPQPIKGARAYYLKTVLHYWSDEHAVKIFESLKPSLVPGYSKVLINDVVIKTTDPDWKTTGEDLAVMMVVGSLERPEARWKRLVSDADLSLVRITSHPAALESIIEVELLPN